MAGAHRRRSLSGRAGRRFVGQAAAAVGTPPAPPPVCGAPAPCRPRCRWCPPAISVPASRWGGFSAGAHTVLEGGSTVGRRALVQRSALLGAASEERTTLYGAVLCPGAAARAGRCSMRGPSWPTGPRPGRTRSCWSGWRCGPAAGYPPGRGSPPPSPRAA